jgi:hypothetical protein
MDCVSSGSFPDATFPNDLPKYMTDLEFQALLEKYSSLETRVGHIMQEICSPFCKVCIQPCCRVGICREAAESPFLLAVQQSQSPSKIAFDPKLGYLGPRGCKLGAGRPPVCHAFVCGPVLRRQESDMHRYALECLGDLVGFIGKRVCRGRQLVEALTDSDMRASNMAEFQNRLNTAEAAIIVLDEFLTKGRKPSDRDMNVLAIIRKPS